MGQMMSTQTTSVQQASRGRMGRKGAVTVIFATAAVPLAMSLGLAVDYGFYNEALTQSTMAADSAAIHAVRVAVTTYNAKSDEVVAAQAGATAAQQWYQAQLGTLATGQVPVATINGLFGVPSWKTTRVSAASSTANLFMNLYIVADTSGSMSIGTTPDDMLKIQQASVCMPTAMAARYLSTGSQSSVFKYLYSDSGVGYANGNTIPTPTAHTAGACDKRYTGDPRLCQPTPLLIPSAGTTWEAPNVDQYGFCPTAGFGVVDKSSTLRVDPQTKKTANLPVPTCSLACHDSSTGQDLTGLVRAANQNGAGISLRVDVVLAATAEVINSLIAKEAQLGLPNQFGVGVYTIGTSNGKQVYPAPGGAFNEASTDLSGALTAVQAMQGTNDSTDIDDALLTLASEVKAAGKGGLPTTPVKNLFIVTDGLQDFLFNGSGHPTRWLPVSNSSCAALKNKGINIFVLYTPYYPLPHYQYLDSLKPMFEPAATSSILSALQACATTPAQFFQASSTTEIQAAMQQMLNLALNTPASITQ